MLPGRLTLTQDELEVQEQVWYLLCRAHKLALEKDLRPPQRNARWAIYFEALEGYCARFHDEPTQGQEWDNRKTDA
jgi:hypothetical protein